MERYKCDFCTGDSSIDHTLCDAILAGREPNSPATDRVKLLLLEQFPWMAEFAANYEKFRAEHPLIES